MRRSSSLLALFAVTALAGCSIGATGFAVDSNGYHEGSVRASTAEAMVGPDGRCEADVSIDPALMRSTSAGGAMALGATECQVVAQMGGPYSVEIKRGPAGERLTKLMYVSGPRIGIYDFTNNRLTAVEH
jgi:Prokaryotic membrane lipoprotein lipid attachment site